MLGKFFGQHQAGWNIDFAKKRFAGSMPSGGTILSREAHYEEEGLKMSQGKKIDCCESENKEEELCPEDGRSAAVRRLCAESIGEQMPPYGSCGRVHSLFNRACNLEFPGHGLVVLLEESLPRVSWGIRLRGPDHAFTELIGPCAGCCWTEKGMDIDGGVRVETTAIPVWHGDRFSLGGPAQRAAWLALFGVARRRGLSGFCRLFAGDIVSGPEGFILGLARDAARRLRGAWLTQDEKAFLAAARCLVGLGPGLTPAGDDFLGGYFAGLFAQSAAGSGDERILSMTRRVLPLAGTSTGAVAGAFLSRACRGSFSEYLADLARGLAQGEKSADKLEQLAVRVLSFGATSGADALAGLLLTAPPSVLVL